MGMALSDAILDDLMKRFMNSDSDGTISLEAFKTMMHELQRKNEGRSKWGNGNEGFWKGLGGKLTSSLRALSSRSVTRELDAAFKISDVVRVEDLGDLERSHEHTTTLVDPELAPLTLAVYLKEDLGNEPRRLSGGNVAACRAPGEPLVIMCAKPGHVEAWAEAFRICAAWKCPAVPAYPRRKSSWRCSTIDWGFDKKEMRREVLGH